MASCLIINADDFGLTPGINRAVVELHRAGALSSATLMATGDAFDDAVVCARSHPTLGIGCHVVLIDGTPVCDPRLIPTLIGPDGRTFRTSLYHFVQAALRGKIDPADVIKEATAQVHKLQQVGIQVTHLDTHKHTHCLPSISRCLADVAQGCKIRAIRNPFEPKWSVAVADAPFLRRLQLRALSRFEAGFHRILARHSPSALSPSGTLGIAATGTLTEQVLRATLDQLLSNASCETCELCCHPGSLDAALTAQSTRLRSTREVEYAALLRYVPEFLRTPGSPVLIHYGNLMTTEQLSSTIPQPASNERIRKSL